MQFLTARNLASVRSADADALTSLRASGDMTDGTHACSEMHSELSFDALNSSYDRRPNLAMLCHQTDLSSVVSRAA